MGDASISNANGSLFGVHAEALALRQERMRVIASNLANVDTPKYLARDIDFAAALHAATEKQATPANDAVLSGRAPALPPLPELSQLHAVYRVPTQPSLDGNTVDASMEHAAFAKASLEYRASLGFVEDRARTMISALTGQ